MRPIKNPLILFALFANLFFGFFFVLIVAKEQPLSLVLMYASYALVAVASLLRGFARIHAQSKNKHVVGIALFYTVIILLIGPIVSCAAFLIVNFLENLQAGILPDFGYLPAAILFMAAFAASGAILGFVFVLPFIFMNIIFFFRYRASLRRKGDLQPPGAF